MAQQRLVVYTESVEIYRRNSGRLNLNAKTLDGDADLSGYRVLFSVKPALSDKEDDSDAIFKGEFTIDSPTVAPQGYYDYTAQETDVEPGVYLIDTKYFVGTTKINSSTAKLAIVQPTTNRDLND